MATLGIPRNTIEILQKYHFNFQKKFGQNFLIDPTVLDRIIRAARITKEDCVLEIGPGIGTMTQYLAESAGSVVAVEIDQNLIPILKETLAEYDNVSIINDDILKVDLNKIVEEKNGGRPIKVVANLPYYITTPIIMGLFEKQVPYRALRSWCRRRWLTVCRLAPAQRITAHYPWRYSTTLSLRSLQMYPLTVLFPDQMWAVRSFG